MSYKTILWPTDGSEPSVKALKAAVEMAEIFKADLHALQAVYPVPMVSSEGFMPPAPMTFNIPEYEKGLIEETKKALNETIAAHVPEGIKVVSEVRSGEPPEIIIEYIKEKNVELVIMATHGRKGMSHLFLGSVAEKITRNSAVPILIVPILPEE